MARLEVGTDLLLRGDLGVEYPLEGGMGLVGRSVVGLGLLSWLLWMVEALLVVEVRRR